MAAFSDPKQRQDYGLYKEAQAIFKASIEAIMKGDKDTFLDIWYVSSPSAAHPAPHVTLVGPRQGAAPTQAR